MASPSDISDEGLRRLADDAVTRVRSHDEAGSNVTAALIAVRDAARREAFEAAAGVCEDAEAVAGEYEAERLARELAAAIRSLGAKP